MMGLNYSRQYRVHALITVFPQDLKTLLMNEKELLNRDFDELFTLCRSITEPRLETSIDYLKQYIPLFIEKWLATHRSLIGQHRFYSL